MALLVLCANVGHRETAGTLTLYHSLAVAAGKGCRILSLVPEGPMC